MELRKWKRWSTTVTYDSYFATQYKDCFVFFGNPNVTNQVCTLGGCIATVVEVDGEDDYIWSSMPQLSLKKDNIVGSLQLCGGFTCGEEIKMFGTIDSGGLMKEYSTKCWNTCLTKPFSQWSENALPIALSPRIKISPIMYLAAVQKCKQYVIYFYLRKQIRGICVLGHELAVNTVIVSDEEKNQSCLLSTDSVTFDGPVSCAVVGADLFIIRGDKMAKVEKFTHLLVASASADQSTTFSISFDLKVPHANGTLFVVQDTLCVVGGCDDNYEPFSEIYQFDQSAQEWSECGVSAVSRYGTSVVPFTDRKNKEAVFIAGGFKGKDMPCGIIEVLAVNVRSVVKNEIY